MERFFTGQLKNLYLLQAALFVLLFIGLTIKWLLFNSSAALPALSLLMIAFAASSVITIAVYKLTVKDKNSIWLQPVSERIGKGVINSVVSIWLCLFGLIIFITFKEKGSSTNVVIVVILLLLVGLVLGRYLQKRWASHTLLPYGISALGVLLMILIIFAVTGITAR